VKFDPNVDERAGVLRRRRKKNGKEIRFAEIFAELLGRRR
jgi:hypothetical protein